MTNQPIDSTNNNPYSEVVSSYVGKNVANNMESLRDTFENKKSIDWMAESEDAAIIVDMNTAKDDADFLHEAEQEHDASISINTVSVNDASESFASMSSASLSLSSASANDNNNNNNGDDINTNNNNNNSLASDINDINNESFSMEREIQGLEHIDINDVENSPSKNNDDDSETTTFSFISESDRKRKLVETKVERILIPSDNRLITFSEQEHKQAILQRQIHEDAFWVPKDIDMAVDKIDWDKKATPDEKRFLKYVLVFFASSDAIVMENLVERFQNIVQNADVRNFYAFQNAMESIHAITYKNMLLALITDRVELMAAENAIFNKDHSSSFNENDPDSKYLSERYSRTISAKGKWAMKYTKNPNVSFATLLAAYAAVEGVFFSGSFCAIFYFKKVGRFPGLAQSNEYINRDEGLHTKFAVTIYNELINRLYPAEINAMYKEVVQIEQDFICDALPHSMIGMSSAKMGTYIEYVTNRLMGDMGYPPIFMQIAKKENEKPKPVENPFDWMELISMVSKTDFFAHRVTDYDRGDGGATNDNADQQETDEKTMFTVKVHPITKEIRIVFKDKADKVLVAEDAANYISSLFQTPSLTPK